MVDEKDLPMMVQYAMLRFPEPPDDRPHRVTLDGNLCAIKRLPKHATLQSLEIFSPCDLSKIRNRSSCPEGILKELIKLGRRLHVPEEGWEAVKKTSLANIGNI